MKKEVNCLNHSFEAIVMEKVNGFYVGQAVEVTKFEYEFNFKNTMTSGRAYCKNNYCEAWISFNDISFNGLKIK